MLLDFDSFFNQIKEQFITRPVHVGEKVTPAKSNIPIGTIVHVDPGMIKIDWGGQTNIYDLNFFIHNYRLYSEPNEALKEIL